MKKPNFTMTIFSTFGWMKVRKAIGAFSIILTFSFLFVQQAAGQIDCNSTLGCGNKVNISMDDDCDILIEPDMIMREQPYTNEFFDVEARVNGVALPSVTTVVNGQSVKRPRVTRAQVGKTIEVKVILRGCSNSCWGSALIEDKLPPIAETCPCVERITRFEGEIKGNGPMYVRPMASFCEGTSTLTQASDFRVFKFAVSENGMVSINIGPSEGSLPNPSMTLYRDGFNADFPCVNKLTNNMTSYNLALVSGVNYYLVVAVVDGVVDIPLNNLAIEHSTGHILPDKDATVCSMKCAGEDDLLAETALNAEDRPVFRDNCSTSVTYQKADDVEVLGCDSRFSKIIRRTWTATDIYGNKSEPKEQLFYVERLLLSEIECPENVEIACDDIEYLANGAPDPEVTGIPSNLDCQNIQFTYNDFTFDLCGATKKLQRSWLIIDWCNGRDTTCSQAIKIIDDKGPKVECVGDVAKQVGVNPFRPGVVVDINANACTANWPVVPPLSAKDCSKFNWDVRFAKHNGSNIIPALASFVKVDGDIKVEGTVPAKDTSINQRNRPFTIKGLTPGKYWIRYIVTDECDNATNCFMIIEVKDNTAPTAICDGTTAVSIDDNGIAEIFAESIDDYSNDNCGVTKFEIKRTAPTCPGFSNNVNFGPSVKVCCLDFKGANSFVDVVLRVSDAAGNTNECETRVNVQLKRAPGMLCPSPITVNCNNPKLAPWASGTSRFDTLLFGAPNMHGICVGSGPYSSRIFADNRDVKCGSGSIIREWTLVSNPNIKCQQTVNVVSPPFGPTSVVFPGNLTLQTCDLAAATPDALNSRPTVLNTACRDLGISFTDQLFYNTTEACVKIVRTWKVVDWCTYRDSTSTVLEGVQNIKLVGSSGPVFANCDKITVTTDQGDCSTEVVISKVATDGCTDAEDIKYTWKLDINKDGTFNANGLSNRFTRELEVGTHSVTMTAENRCGIITTCKFDVVVNSVKKPTPVCIREVIWVLDASGTTEVWASDFDLKSTGSCGATDSLKFSFNAAGTERSKRFTCADIPNGQVARIPLRMYVIDKFGNNDFCEVILILQDSPLNNACTDVAALLPKVSGRITTEDVKGLSEVEVKLTNMQNAAQLTATTEVQGAYKFDGVDVFDPKTIEADSDKDPLNGVSTLDLVLIQRHILGIAPLNSPYKLLAADINNNASITATDLVSLRKLILGITDKFESNTSWRFVPAYYTFSNPSHPYDYPSKISVDSLFEDMNNVNFIAIKTGDVNGSVQANMDDNITESRTKVALFTTETQEYAQGQLVKIPVKAGDDLTLIGAQMGLKYDNAQLAFEKIEAGILNVESKHINVVNGVIRISYDGINAKVVKADQVLFTVVFYATSKGISTVELDKSNFTAEAYDEYANVMGVDIQLRGAGEVSGENILFQNEPNPFNQNTKIAFELKKAGEGRVSIMDINGKVLFSSVNQFQKGYNVVWVDAAQLRSAGVYYYKVESGTFTSTKKMILIE